MKSLVEDVPDLPNFSRFHDAFRDNAKSATSEGHMRAAYYMAYDAAACEYIKLNDPQIDERLKRGPELVSSKFVIPYPPGFPIMVPGQVITAETIAFMRKLDVKEIHGFNAAKGLELLKPDALASHRSSLVPEVVDRICETRRRQHRRRPASAATTTRGVAARFEGRRVRRDTKRTAPGAPSCAMRGDPPAWTGSAPR